MKQLLIAAFALTFLVTSAEAASGDNSGKERAKQKEEKKKQEKEARGKKKAAVDEVLKAKDKNNDGTLTKDEYLTGEADIEAATKIFDQFNKNKDRALSREEIAASLGM